MKVISSYKIKILDKSKIFDNTYKIYREAVKFYVKVLDDIWEEQNFEEKSDFDKVSILRKFTLKTKQNPKVDENYDFKSFFPKFPSNYHLSSIQQAIGIYSSYHSNLKNWEKENIETRGLAPTLQVDTKIFPFLYKAQDNVYIRTSPTNAKIKAYINGAWTWIDVKLKAQNVRNVAKKTVNFTEDCPILLKQNKRYYLSFPYELDVKFKDKPVKKQIICSIYLGVEPHAVCSIMDSKGNILNRKFIDYKYLRSNMYKAINRIKKAQKEGSRKMPHKWRHVTDLNTEIARMVAKDICEFATQNNSDVVVFEHLDKTGIRKSKNKQMLSLWRGREIQKLVEHKFHTLGKRIATVNGYNVSYLAFDGSGKVERKTDKICTFSTDKIYNTYLNASYNIGARYFIRELIKANSSLKNKPQEELEVLYDKTSKRTLNDLRNFKIKN